MRRYPEREPGVVLEAVRREPFDDLGRCEVSAQKCAELAGVELQDSIGILPVADDAERPRQLGDASFGEQVCDAPCRDAGQRRVGAALEARRSVRVRRQRATADAHRDGIEGLGFEDDLARVVLDLRVFAANDARDGQHLHVVRDHQRADRQLALLGREQQPGLLAGSRETNRDAALNARAIEGVRRLPQLEIDEVGDVDRGVAGEQARGAQQFIGGLAERFLEAAGDAQRRGRVEQALFGFDAER